jgi:hypothetical protein
MLAGLAWGREPKQGKDSPPFFECRRSCCASERRLKKKNVVAEGCAIAPSATAKYGNLSQNDCSAGSVRKTVLALDARRTFEQEEVFALSAMQVELHKIRLRLIGTLSFGVIGSHTGYVHENVSSSAFWRGEIEGDRFQTRDRGSG